MRTAQINRADGQAKLNHSTLSVEEPEWSVDAYADPWDIFRSAVELIKPPKKISVSESAERNVQIVRPAGYNGPWDASLTPYMREPMNMLTSRAYRSLIFIGPAQCGKTQALIEGLIAYIACCDQSDCLIIDSSQDKARDFSRMRVDRLHRHSPNIQAQLSKYGHSDNTYDKTYAAGNILFIRWPSINQVSGKAVKYAAATDLDRMPLDIDKEGALFDLLMKRTQTYMSRGMTLVDTSPGYTVRDPQWRQRHPHEAPPTFGGLALYNNGDRRWYYWQCPDCQEWFVPGPGLTRVSIPETGNMLERAKGARYVCPHCGSLIDGQRKRELNLGGRWLREGEMLTIDGEVYGEPLKSDSASFWLHGTQAAFQPLHELVIKYLQAEALFDATGDEQALKTTVNVDQGSPYLPRTKIKCERDASLFDERREFWQQGIVPEGVRFLTAAVDVQINRFECLVLGFGVGKEIWVVDHFKVTNSESQHRETVLPANYIEDWNLLEAAVLSKRYPCRGNKGYSMPIMAAACDSGGMPGVTENAYSFYRAMARKGYRDKLYLIKGGSARNAARVRRSETKGNVALQILNTDALKDAVWGHIDRETPGPGYVHFPEFLPETFFKELTKEIRDPKKGWISPDNAGGNEALDLMVYCYAAALIRGLERIDWENPRQPWARMWENNPFLLEGNSTPGRAHQREESIPVTETNQRAKDAGGNRSGWLNINGSWF